MVGVFTGVILFFLRMLRISFHGRGGPNTAPADQGMHLTPKDAPKHDSPGTKHSRRMPHFIFMTDAKNYRSVWEDEFHGSALTTPCRLNADHGSLTALLVAPAVAGSMLLQASMMPKRTAGAQNPLPSSRWLIEPPINTGMEPGPLHTLIYSRSYLLQLTTFCSFLLLLHIILSASWHTLRTHILSRPTIPQYEGRRTFFFFACAFTIIPFILGLRYLVNNSGRVNDPWQGNFYAHFCRTLT